MERTTSISRARKLFKKDFIGLEELRPLFKKLNKAIDEYEIPEIPYPENELIQYAGKYILILGLPRALDKWPLNIENLRNGFGLDPAIQEPCFYNQDWYIKESFVLEQLELKWYLIKKDVIEESRACQPDELVNQMKINLPSAILATYTFFAYYLLNNEILWGSDFIWCNDFDHNGDRIYVGRYIDRTSLNKNGFSIHRHLKLRSCYAATTII